jgi:hypothetical protein
MDWTRGRKNTSPGRPLGLDAFVESLGKSFAAGTQAEEGWEAEKEF